VDGFFQGEGCGVGGASITKFLAIWNNQPRKLPPWKEFGSRSHTRTHV
jgi:hypothetical protein